METLAVIIGIISLVFLLALSVIVVILLFQNRKLQINQGDISPILQNLTQAVQQEQTQVAVLGEKLSHIEPITQTVSDLHSEVRGLNERVMSVENNQLIANQGVGYLANNALTTFTELKTLTNGLVSATSAMRSELDRAQNDLTQLHTHAKADQEAGRQIAESIRRLETVIAGTQTKGSAGENILEVVFAKLPVEWQVRNFHIGGKTVEFGLKLPNNMILPIDSKWAATNLLEKFISSDDIAEQQSLKKAIEDAVLQKAKEVRKYIDPSITVNFGVAVIPDAIYDLCSGIQTQVFQMSVVLVSYSMFVPYLLLVFQTILKTNQSIDLQRLDAYIQTAQENIKVLQDELDGRFSRAITMLNNSRDDMRVYMSRIGGSLTGLQIGASTTIATLPETISTEEILENQTNLPNELS
jgi:DNA recombination protein RmuC